MLQGEEFDALAPLFDQWAGGPGQTFYETAKNAGIAKYAEQYPQCSRAYGAWAVDFLKAAKASGKPFCLSVSFKAPHLPFSPDPLDLQLYEGKTFTRPPNLWRREREASIAAVQNEPRLDELPRAGQRLRSLCRELLCAHHGVDAAVGMIRAGLASEGLADNTVILFTSDNGYNSGSHGFGDKVIPYEEGSKLLLSSMTRDCPSNMQAG